MKIYSGPLCIYGHACRIVLHEKTIEHETVYVKPGEMVERMAELNPYGETPILQDRDLVLYGPTLINEYLDGGFEVLRDFQTAGGIVMALGKWEKRKDSAEKKKWNK